MESFAKNVIKVNIIRSPSLTSLSHFQVVPQVEQAFWKKRKEMRVRIQICSPSFLAGARDGSPDAVS